MVISIRMTEEEKDLRNKTPKARAKRKRMR